MNIEMKASNRQLFGLVLTLVAISGVGYVYSTIDTDTHDSLSYATQAYFAGAFVAATHPESSIVIKIDGTDRTLQYAASNILLNGRHTYSSASSSNPGHDASQVLVNVNEVEKTLLAALSSGFNGLCGSGSYSTYSSSNIPNPGHVATEVMLSSGNLQQAIDARTFCAVDGGWSAWSACNQPCGGGTQTKTCNNPPPANGGADCVGSSSQSCNIQSCTYSWITGSWSAWTTQSTCLADSTRTVYCRRNQGSLTVEDSYCTASKPYTYNTCDLCRWQLYFGAAVVFTAPYCPVSAPCDAGDLGTSIDCKRADGSCFFFWCTGDDQICELHPTTDCSHYG
jgi:hypothetical protein